MTQKIIATTSAKDIPPQVGNFTNFPHFYIAPNISCNIQTFKYVEMQY